MAVQKIYRAVETPPIVFCHVAAAWETATDYVVGHIVTDSGNTYFCLIAHTSGTFATDLAAGKWVLITPILWTLTGVAAGAGRISSVWDRGSGNKPVTYRWRASTHWVATPTAGDSLRLYLPTSYALATAKLTDGIITFGDAGLASEAITAADVMHFGTVSATAADQQFVRSGLIDIWDRYVGVIGWNSSATKALIADSTTIQDQWCMFEAMPLDLEAAA